MNLFCSEEHELIRASVRSFAETQIKPLVLQLDEEEAFSVELTREMGKLGLLGITVPESGQYSSMVQKNKKTAICQSCVQGMAFGHLD